MTLAASSANCNASQSVVMHTRATELGREIAAVDPHMAATPAFLPAVCSATRSATPRLWCWATRSRSTRLSFVSSASSLSASAGPDLVAVAWLRPRLQVSRPAVSDLFPRAHPASARHTRTCCVRLGHVRVRSAARTGFTHGISVKFGSIPARSCARGKLNLDHHAVRDLCTPACSLRSNQIGGAGVSALSEALKFNATLTTLECVVAVGIGSARPAPVQRGRLAVPEFAVPPHWQPRLRFPGAAPSTMPLPPSPMPLPPSLMPRRRCVAPRTPCVAPRHACARLAHDRRAAHPLVWATIR